MNPLNQNSIQDFLLENLECQIEYHNSLLELLTAEAELQANCKLEDLNHLQVEKKKFAHYIQEKEVQRISFLKERLGLSDAATIPKLSNLLLHFPQESQDELSQVKQHLIELIDSIKIKTKFVAEIAKARLISIKSLLNEIDAQFDSPQKLYSAKGAMQQKKQSLFMRKWV